MKTLRILILITTFFTVGKAWGQADSSYALNAVILNDTLKASFYSTYDLEAFKELNITFLDPQSKQYLSQYNGTRATGNILSSSDDAILSYVPQSNNVQKFIIEIPLTQNLKNRALQIDFRTWGSNFKSNTLSFYKN